MKLTIGKTLFPKSLARLLVMVSILSTPGFALPAVTPSPMPGCSNDNVPENLQIAIDYLTTYPATSLLMSNLETPFTRISYFDGTRAERISGSSNLGGPFVTPLGRRFDITTKYECISSIWVKKSSYIDYFFSFDQSVPYSSRLAKGTVELDATDTQQAVNRTVKCTLNDSPATITANVAYEGYHVQCSYAPAKCTGNSNYEHPDLILNLINFKADFNQEESWKRTSGYSKFVADQTSTCKRESTRGNLTNTLKGGGVYSRRNFRQFGSSSNRFATTSSSSVYPDSGYSEYSVTSEALLGQGQSTGIYFKFIANNDLSLSSSQQPQNGLVSSSAYWGSCNSSSAWSCPYLAPETVSFKYGWFSGTYVYYTGLVPYASTSCAAGSPLETTVIARVGAYQSIASGLKALPGIGLPTGCSAYVK